MAIDIDVQRLQLGDVILIDLSDQDTNIEARVVRNPEIVRAVTRSEGTVRATVRVSGRDDFVIEWPWDHQVTLIRGP